MDPLDAVGMWYSWQLQGLIVDCVKLKQKSGHFIRKVAELVVCSQVPASSASSGQVYIQCIESALKSTTAYQEVRNEPARGRGPAAAAAAPAEVATALTSRHRPWGEEVGGGGEIKA